MELKYIRWIIGLILLVISTSLFYSGITAMDSGEDTKESLSKISDILLAIVFLVLGLLSVGKELASLIARPITKLIGDIFMSEEKFDKPPLNYKLLDFYIKENKHENALDECEKFMDYYPKEVKPYKESALINANIYAEFDEAEKILTKANKLIPDNPEILETIKEVKNSKSEYEHNKIEGNNDQS